MDSFYHGRKIKLTDLDIDPIKILKRDYDLDVISIETVKAVGKVKLEDRNICFKRAKSSEEKVWFIYSAITHLIKNGFTKTVPFILTKAGLPFTKVNDQIFYATEWIEGDICQFAKPEDLKAGAVTLAQLHEYSKGFIPPPESKPKVVLGKWPKILKQRNNDLKKFKTLILAKNEKSDFDKLYLQNYNYYQGLADMACQVMNFNNYYQVLIDEAQKHHTFTHRDVADRNFIIVPNGEAHIIDFDYCRFDIRINDLLRMIERTLKDLQWNFDICRNILDAYQLVSPLKSAEYVVLFAFLLFPQKLWRTANRYYQNKEEWTDNELLKKIEEYYNRKAEHNLFLEKFYQVYCKELFLKPL